MGHSTRQGISHDAFIAAAPKNGTDLKPVAGDRLAHLIDDLLGAPQTIKDKVRAAMPDRT